MNKNVIRLTEEDLNNIIKESVQQILKENPENEGFWNNLKTGAKTFMNNDNRQGLDLKNRWNAAKSNFKTQGEYDDIKDLIQKLSQLLDQRKISPQTTVAQLVGGKYNTDAQGRQRMGTMTGMANNRMSQMRKRGLQKPTQKPV